MTKIRIRFTYAVDEVEAKHFFDTDNDYDTLEECLDWRSQQDQPEQYQVFRSLNDHRGGFISMEQVIHACASCEMTKADVLNERAIMHTPDSVCCGEVA